MTFWPWTCTTCCAMLWDSLHKVSTQSSYPFMKSDDFFTLIRHVTLWPWPLTLDLELLWSFGRPVFKLCVKFAQNRTIRCRVIDDLAINFPGEVFPSTTPQRGLGRTLPNLERTELYHRRTQRETLVAICCFVLKWQLLKDERCWAIRPKIALFDPCKN